MFPSLKTSFFSLLPLLIFAMTAAISMASQAAPLPDYQLAVSFDLARNTLTGTARISIAEGQTVTLHTGGLKITGILLKRQDGSSHEVKVPEKPTFQVPASDKTQEIFISYMYTITNDNSNLITTEGIALLSDWYPLPDRRMRYQLSATLPDGFTAITESDRFPLARTGNSVTATFSQPVTTIHFSAGPYVMQKLKVRDELQVYTLFFPEDRGLAAGYLTKSRDYIRRYEQEIGPFPYSHYVIVANRNPTGLGMPTFTLLGQSVLRLPFIKDTSLGHEILHSWFGNSIDIDPEQGNWCEGLTAYLSDHAYRQDAEEGAAYRKETILNYLSYVKAENVIPLSAFHSGSHTQSLAEARRAVGYSRGMMFFHELQERIGRVNFARGIRNFYTTFRNRTASWDDIRDIFNEVLPNSNLTDFFAERLTRTDIPAFQAKDVSITQKGNESVLQFQLVQEATPPYLLQVPIRVITAEGTYDFTTTTDSTKTEVTLTLPNRPLGFTLDPDYTLLRKLDFSESPAIWSQFMGSDKKLVILESKEATQTYQPLLQQLGKRGWTTHYDNEISNAELRDADLLILGLNQQASRNLFGSLPLQETGFTLDVRHNPLNPEHVAVLVSSSSTEESASVASRLSHYGKYGFLQFHKGRVIDKRIPESTTGIPYQLEQLPVGGSTRPLASFDKIVQELQNLDVIYVGESHTSLSDHRLQLRLLEALSTHVDDLAIGMEMFPDTSQDALNAYIFGDPKMTEKEFLKASRYFDVWQYDYRYFREIFQLARQRNIPVIGINLERAIVSTVYKTGSTDDLPPATRNSLPSERDLDMPGYGERLRTMHSIHEQGSHGSGLASGFIQAQAIWDETMAANIAKYLKGYPGRKMLILAGTEHTRKDSGIPPRVARRLAVQQASILNISDGPAPSDLAEVADYFFISEPMELSEPAKMGIMLEEHKTTNDEYVEILDFSPESKALDAGLRKGDIIRAVSGYPISTMEDIRISMLDSDTTDTVRVRIERRDGEKPKQLEFTVELTRAETEKQHP